MRGILLQPWMNRIIEVYVEPGIEGIYKTLSYKDWKVTCFSCPEVIGDGAHTIFLDVDAFFKAGVKSMNWEGYPEPLFGNALILGHNDQGESTDCTLELDYVLKMVSPSSYITMGKI